MATMTAGYQTIVERVTGRRTIRGTDWPVIDRVQIFRPGPGRGQPDWTVALGLCNGAPASSRVFPTHRAALEFYTTAGPVIVDTVAGWDGTPRPALED